MAKQDLEKRVDNIEETLTLLNTLPARVGGLDARLSNLETQFLQFRAEVRGEFSAIRTELAETQAHAQRLHDSLHGTVEMLATQVNQMYAEMRQGFARLTKEP